MKQTAGNALKAQECPGDAKHTACQRRCLSRLVLPGSAIKRWHYIRIARFPECHVKTAEACENRANTAK